MTVHWLLFKLVLSGIMAKMKGEYREAWADENDQEWQGEMKWSTEEDAEKTNERGWTVTQMPKASNGQDAQVIYEIKEEGSGKKKWSLCCQSLQRKGKDISMSNIMTEFSFGSHST